MTRGLTFDQVADAGVFAWREDGYLYVDGRLLRVRNGDPARIEVTASALRPDEAMHSCFRDRRWRHLPDCGCVHCQSGNWRLPREGADRVAADGSPILL